MNITANMYDPNLLGFEITKQKYLQIRDFLKRNKVSLPIWAQIQNDFLKNKRFWKKHNEIKWILTIKFNKIKKPSQFLLKIKRPFVLLTRFIKHKLRKLRKR